MSDYTADLEINKNKLDIEWQHQPQLYMQYAELDVLAQEERDKAIRNLGVVKAELDADIRSDPKRFGIEKATEAAIANVIINTKRYRDADAEVIEKTKRAKLLSAAVVAFEHRKRALTKLTDLWISGFYGEMTVSQDRRAELEARRTNNQLEGLARNRRRRIQVEREED